MFRLSALAKSIQPSATMAAGAKAKELRAQGIEVFDFSLGEPDFGTPVHIQEAAQRAMHNEDTHYTPAAGSAQARKAVADWYGQFYKLDVDPNQVILSNGAKHSICTALYALLGPGDEVIVPAPYWVSYSDLVEMTGAKPVFVDTTLDNRFKMSPQQLQQAITPKTRLLMLNSPSNPTGVVYSRDELSALMDVIADSDVAVLSDEIYELLTYDHREPCCLAELRPELRDRIITISGASKGYAMTGWRMGWTVASADLVKAMTAIQSQQTGCPSSISQAATIAALNGSTDSVAEMRAEFEARRDLVCSLLETMPKVRFAKPDGAFYVFMDVGTDDSIAFCTKLLEEAHVNLVPGIAFGLEGFARMSFATDRATLEQGLNKLADWLSAH